MALIIPCHRVLAAGGKIGGFSAPGGSAAKIRMLESRAFVSSNRARHGSRLTTPRSSNGAGQPNNHEEGLTGRPSAAGSHDGLPDRQQQGVSPLIRGWPPGISPAAGRRKLRILSGQKPLAMNEIRPTLTAAEGHTGP